jgi:hypothetical protein
VHFVLDRTNLAVKLIQELKPTQRPVIDDRVRALVLRAILSNDIEPLHHAVKTIIDPQLGTEGCRIIQQPAPAVCTHMPAVKNQSSLSAQAIDGQEEIRTDIQDVIERDWLCFHTSPPSDNHSVSQLPEYAGDASTVEDSAQTHAPRPPESQPHKIHSANPETRPTASKARTLASVLRDVTVANNLNVEVAVDRCKTVDDMKAQFKRLMQEATAEQGFAFVITKTRVTTGNKLLNICNSAENNLHSILGGEYQVYFNCERQRSQSGGGEQRQSTSKGCECKARLSVTLSTESARINSASLIHNDECQRMSAEKLALLAKVPPETRLEVMPQGAPAISSLPEEDQVFLKRIWPEVTVSKCP